MTAERKRALFIIIATLIVGILIGALADGLIERQKLQRAGWRKDGKEGFIQKVFAAIEADSVQAKKIRPYILEAIAKVDSLQEQTDAQVHIVVDSFEMKMRPILSEEQMEMLRQFHKRGRSKQ